MWLYDTITSELKVFFVKENVAIDNFVFYLHSKVTVLLLISFSTVIAGFEYFGNPIECYSDSLSVEKKTLDIFCWISTTYSLPDLWNASVGDEVVYPGVGNSYPETSRTYHSYYQWVVFVLYFQALAFTVPKYLWNAAENNLTSFLTEKLRFTMMKPEVRLQKLKRLALYIEETKNEHSCFWFFVLCEMLNLTNVLGQMFFLDRFLSGKFWSLGSHFIQWTQADDNSYSSVTDELNIRNDPLLEVFPRMTKCSFYKFGSSGDLERFDAFCILTINHVNEKVFLILWFWLHFLAAISLFYFIWRLCIIFSKDFRIMSMQLSCSIASRTSIESIVATRSVPQWFMLKILARNMDERNFDDLSKILLHQLEVDEESIKLPEVTVNQPESECKSELQSGIL